jgi:SAM-dependent methyltransferase
VSSEVHRVVTSAAVPIAKGGGAETADDLPSVPTGSPADYVERNRAVWERLAPGHAAAAREAWQEEDLRWGIWGLPESQLRLLDGLGAHDDVLELGCGSAVISAWLARHSMRPVAVDIAQAQIDTAERLQGEFRVSFPLICANAEEVPYDKGSFDAAVSDYGASLWCNPRRWLPEARRLLRPGGKLIFITNGALLMACTPGDGGPAQEHLVRDYFSRYRVEFSEDSAVEFHLSHGHWIRLLRANQFVLENLIEARPPLGAKSRFEFVSLEWARRWPSEEIWIARKAG